MSKKVKDYLIIENTDPTELSSRVMRALDDGYELVGGVSMSIIDGSYFYMQALVKYVS